MAKKLKDIEKIIIQKKKNNIFNKWSKYERCFENDKINEIKLIIIKNKILKKSCLILINFMI